MRLVAVVGVMAILFILAGCTTEKAAPEQQTTAGEAVTEPTAEQVESELDAAPLDEIESDLDLLILE